MINEIYKNVLEAMQQADEMHGVEGLEYIILMEAISSIALMRAQECKRNIWAPKKQGLVKGDGWKLEAEITCDNDVSLQQALDNLAKNVYLGKQNANEASDSYAYRFKLDK